MTHLLIGLLVFLILTRLLAMLAYLSDLKTIKDDTRKNGPELFIEAGFAVIHKFISVVVYGSLLIYVLVNKH